MELTLGIDLGTSYFKLGLFDREGQLRGLGRVGVLKSDVNGLQCELTVKNFWALLREGLSCACRQAGVDASQIQAISYSSQANSFVLLDHDLQPLTPLILWPDLRVEKSDDSVYELFHREDFQEVTGMGFYSRELCLEKLCWFRRNEPELWSRVCRVMTISDYLVYCLTGNAIGDEATASLLGLWDLQSRQWWDEALQTVRLDRSLFSQPLRPGSSAGAVNLNGSKRLCVKPGVAVAVGTLDHHAASIGAGLCRLADLSVSVGTVIACLGSKQCYEILPNCCTGPGCGEEEYYQLSFNNNGASALQWYQKEYARELSIVELVRLAGTVGMGSDGLFALPETNQYNDLDGFINRKPSHHHGHFVRAIMESSSASLIDLVNLLCADDPPNRVVVTGGGAKSDLWQQIRANLLDMEIITPNCAEPACCGAGMFAAVAAGWFAGLQEVGKAWLSAEKKFKPDPVAVESYRKWYKRWKEVVSEHR